MKTAKEFKFVRADKLPNILYYPHPWVLGAPHEAKMTLCPLTDQSNRFLAGFADDERGIIIGLFPLNATVDSEPSFVVLLQERANTNIYDLSGVYG